MQLLSKTTVFVFFFLMLCASNSLAQNSPSSTKTLCFDIVAFDRTVGQLTTTKKTEGSEIRYKSATKVSVRVIKMILVVFNFNVSFKNGTMKCADIKASVNDDVFADTYTELVNNVYKVYKKGVLERELKVPIHYSTIRLYFEEPETIKSCYAEQQGSFNTITPLGNHGYKITNEKGMENFYYYKDGVLQRAVIDAGLIDFEIVVCK